MNRVFSDTQERGWYFSSYWLVYVDELLVLAPGSTQAIAISEEIKSLYEVLVYDMV